MPVTNYFTDPESYNATFFDSVHDAALGVASPFLIQQNNQQLAGAVVNGNEVSYGENTFTVHTDYINPGPGYYAATPPAFQQVWQTDQFPNAVYDRMAGTFLATIDCVGFASRVLVAVGSGDPVNNAFCLFHSQVDSNAAHFAAPGFVPSAFELAVNLPVILPGRWSYVSGNVSVSAIQNQENQQGKNYTGAAKGNFAAAQAGDIVCFGYEDGDSNGHFMVLTDAPQQVALTQFASLPSLVANAYMISVYDSTADKFSLHFNDSRLNDGDSGSGVGFGQLYIFTNSADEPVGFIFGPAGTGMEMPHFLNGLLPAQDGLLVAAISIGRFQ